MSSAGVSLGGLGAFAGVDAGGCAAVVVIVAADGGGVMAVVGVNVILVIACAVFVGSLSLHGFNEHSIALSRNHW